jgi:hypothetical protein
LLRYDDNLINLTNSDLTNLYYESLTNLYEAIDEFTNSNYNFLLEKVTLFAPDVAKTFIINVSSTYSDLIKYNNKLHVI